jgi:hypothetical protein
MVNFELSFDTEATPQSAMWLLIQSISFIKNEFIEIKKNQSD